MAIDQQIPQRSALAGSLSLIAIALVLVMAGLAAIVVVGLARPETVTGPVLQILGLAGLAAAVCAAIWGLLRLNRR